MTYREQIQAMIAEMERLYVLSHRMRDLAFENEKFFWNGFRLHMDDPLRYLRGLDNNLSDASAQREID